VEERLEMMEQKVKRVTVDLQAVLAVLDQEERRETRDHQDQR